MKKLSLLLAMTLGAPMAALAAEESPHTFTANVGLYSQYIFRGLTQTNEEPAIQGGLDYSHSSGFYLGTWGSNISWLRDTDGAGGNWSNYASGGSLELDVYGGYRTTLGPVGIDVGALYYWYPGDIRSAATTPACAFAFCIEADTFELYAAATWKWFTLKYSHSLGDTFGVDDADGTYYLDFSAAVPVGETGLTVGAHYGIQNFSGNDVRNAGGASNDNIYSYDDWKISLTYDLGKLGDKLSGTTLGVMYTDVNGANNLGYGSVAQGGSYPSNIADSQVTVWVQKVF